MKKLILSAILTLAFYGPGSIAADVKISQLPLGVASLTGVNDSFPFVSSSTDVTKRLTLWDLSNLPTLVSTYAPKASPVFTGTVTAPTFIGALTGNASTATALASNPTDCSANQFANAIDASGNLTCSAVAATTLSGILGLSHGGSGSDLSGTGGTSQVLKQTTLGGVVTVARLACSDLSNSSSSCSTDATNAANISSGLLGLARGGAHADLSGTGGTSQVLKQTTLGGDVTVARLACSDLSNSSTSCSTDATNASNISTGTLALARGGTGQVTQTAAFDALSPNTTLGDVTFHNGTNNVRLAGNITSTTKFLTQTGTGSVSAAPSWTQPTCSSLSNAAASCSTDTTSATNISAGTLAVARGGTGIGSGTSGGVLAFTASGTIASSGALTAHGVVVGGGAGVAPAATSAGSSGQVLTSNGASADPTFQAAPSAPTSSYYHGTQAGTWTTTSATYVDGTNAGGNALTSVTSNGLTITAGASNVAGITFTPAATTDVFLVTASFNLRNNTVTDDFAAQLTDGTTAIDENSFQNPNATGFVGAIKLTGIFAPGSTSAQTVKIQIKASGGTTTLDAFINTVSVRWGVVKIR